MIGICSSEMQQCRRRRVGGGRDRGAGLRVRVGAQMVSGSWRCGFLDRYRSIRRQENEEHAELYVEVGSCRWSGRPADCQGSQVPRRAPPIRRRRAVGKCAGARPDAAGDHGEFGDPNRRPIADGSGFRKYSPRRRSRPRARSTGEGRQLRVGRIPRVRVAEGRRWWMPLYLPAWAKDAARQRLASQDEVPEELAARLTEIKRCRAVLPHAWILADRLREGDRVSGHAASRGGSTCQRPVRPARSASTGEDARRSALRLRWPRRTSCVSGRATGRRVRSKWRPIASA